VVESTALEMRRTCKGIGGSNPSLSAILLRITFVTFAFCAVLMPGPSHACSCHRWDKARYVNEAFTVFEGRVMSTRSVRSSDDAPFISGQPAEQVTSLKVLNRIKGEIPDDVEVFTIRMESLCGFDFDRYVGQTITIGTYKETAPRSVTGYCWIIRLNERHVTPNR
jgi:hypothetical protein